MSFELDVVDGGWRSNLRRAAGDNAAVGLTASLFSMAADDEEVAPPALLEEEDEPPMRPERRSLRRLLARAVAPGFLFVLMVSLVLVCWKNVIVAVVVVVGHSQVV